MSRGAAWSPTSAMARAGTGNFHEVLNLAALWRLPLRGRAREQLLFDVDADRSSRRRSRAVASPTGPTATAASRSRTCDGNDVVRGHAARSRRCWSARGSATGPAFVQCRYVSPRWSLEERPVPLPHQGRRGRVEGARPVDSCSSSDCSWQRKTSRSTPFATRLRTEIAERRRRSRSALAAGWPRARARAT